MNLDLYRDLFVHRDDVFAQQQPDGAYYPVRRKLTDDELDEHLAGFASYGCYVIDPAEREWTDKYEVERGPRTNTVKYVLFDLDSFDPEQYTALIQCLEDFAVGVTSGTLDDFPFLLMERSGGKGYHAWLFLDAPLHAAQVRAWVNTLFMPLWNSRTDSATLEVFPKQDTVLDGGFGNLVKLPLGVHAVSGKRSEFIHVQGWASDVTDVQKLDASLVPAYVPQRGRSGTGAQAPSTETLAAPFACVSKIISEGAPSGFRDNAMFHVALYAAKHGFPEDLALDWCERLNENFDPPLRESEVRTKVESAYRTPITSSTCNADWLRGFCPGGERCFGKWNEQRPGNREVEGAYWQLSREERMKLRKRS